MIIFWLNTFIFSRSSDYFFLQIKVSYCYTDIVVPHAILNEYMYIWSNKREVLPFENSTNLA